MSRVPARPIIPGRVRLRLAAEQTSDGQDLVFKLTQKIPGPEGGPGLITSMYLTAEEHRIFAQLPADRLGKTRHSIPPYGVDTFVGVLQGLTLAEVEFSTDAEMSDFKPAKSIVAEVTYDQRFTGGHLASARRGDMTSALAEYGITL